LCSNAFSVAPKKINCNVAPKFGGLCLNFIEILRNCTTISAFPKEQGKISHGLKALGLLSILWKGSWFVSHLVKK
jgi:hypothetical protein